MKFPLVAALAVCLAAPALAQAPAYTTVPVTPSERTAAALRRR